MSIGRMRTDFDATEIISDDLLASILTLLPPDSVLQSMFVSKRWHGLITDPLFHQIYSSRNMRTGTQIPGVHGRLMAFIQNRTRFFLPDHHNKLLNILLTTDVHQRNNNDGHCIINQVPRGFGEFIHSSNGLILCGNFQIGYFVINPLNRMWVRLARIATGYAALALVYEENTRAALLNFKVVLVPNWQICDADNELGVQTYSSKTGEWAKSTLVSTEKFEVYAFKTPYVFKGIVHWYTTDKSLAVYDTNGDGNFVQLMDLPYVGNEFNWHFTRRTAFTRSSADQVLWFGIMNVINRSVTFWMLPKGDHGSYTRGNKIPKHEWVLMHTIVIDYLPQDITKLVFAEKQGRAGTIYVTIGENRVSKPVKLAGFLSGERIYAILSLDGAVYVYDLESKSAELVKYRGTPIPGSDSEGWFPYMEPLCLSSYALSSSRY